MTIINILMFAICSIGFGEYLDYYDSIWWWDLFLHTWSGVGLCYFICKHTQYRWIAMQITMSILVTWELFEFFMDHNFNLNMQKDGIQDTMEDIVFGKIGAFLGLFYFALKGKS